MAGFMDKMKNKAKAASGDQHARLEELQRKQQEGKLNEEGRAELERLREQTSRKDK